MDEEEMQYAHTKGVRGFDSYVTVSYNATQEGITRSLVDDFTENIIEKREYTLDGKLKKIIYFDTEGKTELEEVHDNPGSLFYSISKVV